MVTWLEVGQAFPPLEMATADGLLAVGGVLDVPTLLAAYRQGIFPWYGREHPVLWWSPSPRMVLYVNEVKISRSLAKVRRNRAWHVTFDRCFVDVMRHCATALRGGEVVDTWIDDAMCAAYTALHHEGYAHSVELWQDEQLVGGLYGVCLGKMFFGESMFSRRADASKLALVQLCEHLRAAGFALIDCQVYTPHLASLGARLISREHFSAHLAAATVESAPSDLWKAEYCHVPIR